MSAQPTSGGAERDSVLKRRSVLICLGASVAGAISHSQAMAALTGPRFPCGCVSKRPIGEFDSCLVHDETGKRWDDYTLEDVCRFNRTKISVVGPDDAWSCGCGPHSALCDLPVGTRGVWHKTDYWHDEWEFRCEVSEIVEFVAVQTTDWAEWAKEFP